RRTGPEWHRARVELKRASRHTRREVSHAVFLSLRYRDVWPGHDRIRHRGRCHPRHPGHRRFSMEQRARDSVASARHAATDRPMRARRGDDRGMATLETTLMLVILVPLLFAILEFGWLTQRWLAQDGVAIQAARYAGELGGDSPE